MTQPKDRIAALTRCPPRRRRRPADPRSFTPQTTALRNSLSGLDTAIKSEKGQPPVAAAEAIASSVTQVKS